MNKNASNEEIEELKSMQNYPKLYAANYFEDLKNKVDLTFIAKDNENNEQDKYLEIINKIESFEQETYNKIKPFNTFDNEINLITNTNEIDEIKYKIEKIIFSNKSILFLNDLLFIEDKRFFFNENNIKILLILNDIYLKINNNNNNDLIHFNRDKLIYNFVKDLLVNQMDNTNNAVINLNILDKIIFIDMTNKNIESVDSLTFNCFININKIDFSVNKIKQLDSTIFNGLINLEVIDFGSNEIKELHPKLFNGLEKLKQIYFYNNKIQNIDPLLFNNLTNLTGIYFAGNKIKEIHSATFNGLTNLKEIIFHRLISLDEFQFVNDYNSDELFIF